MTNSRICQRAALTHRAHEPPGKTVTRCMRNESTPSKQSLTSQPSCPENPPANHSCTNPSSSGTAMTPQIPTAHCNLLSTRASSQQGDHPCSTAQRPAHRTEVAPQHRQRMLTPARTAQHSALTAEGCGGERTACAGSSSLCCALRCRSRCACAPMQQLRPRAFAAAVPVRLPGRPPARGCSCCLLSRCHGVRMRHGRGCC